MFEPMNAGRRRGVLAGLCADLAAEYGLPTAMVRAVVLVLAVMPTAVTYFVVAWLAERRRGGSGLGTVLGGGGGSRFAPRPGLMAVRDQFARLDGRLGEIEAFVSSRDFELHKGFRGMRK